VIVSNRSRADGFLDPNNCRVGIEELRETRTSRSGRYGVSGICGDLSRSSKQRTCGSSRARLAYERFVLSVRRTLGAMAGVLGGVDVIVFTGGIGENSARVCWEAASALRFAGLGFTSSSFDRGRISPSKRRCSACDGKPKRESR